MKYKILIFLIFVSFSNSVLAQKYETGILYNAIYSKGFFSQGPTFQFGIRCIGHFDFRINGAFGYQNYELKEKIFCGRKFLYSKSFNEEFFQAGIIFQPVFYLKTNLAFAPSIEANFLIDYKEDFYYGYGGIFEWKVYDGYKQICRKDVDNKEIRIFLGIYKTEGIIIESLFSGWKTSVGIILAF